MNSQTAVPERLDALRRAHPEIDTAVLVDHRAGTVLCMSTCAGQRQEKLDGIVAAAARFLDGPFGPRDFFALSSPVDLLVVHAAGGDTALALIFAPEVDPAEAGEVAARAVRRLGDGAAG